MAKRKSAKRRTPIPIPGIGSPKPSGPGFTGGIPGGPSSGNYGERDASTGRAYVPYVPPVTPRVTSLAAPGELGPMYPAAVNGVGGYMDNSPGAIGAGTPSSTNFWDQLLKAATLNHGAVTRNVQKFQEGAQAVDDYDKTHAQVTSGGFPTAGGQGVGAINQFPNDRDRGSGNNWVPPTSASGAGSGGLLGGGFDLGGLLNGLIHGPMDAARQIAANSVFGETVKPPSYTPVTYDYQPIQLPAYKPFEYKQNDFTDQANAAAAKAYSPQFAAIEQARQEATSREGQQDQLVKGIGSQLLTDLAKVQGGRQTQLADAATAATQAGADQAAATQQSYQNDQAQLAALMNQYGGGVAPNGGLSPELARVAGDSQARQDAARTTAAQNATGLNQQKVDAAAGDSEINRATALQTSSDRQDLISQLNQALFGYDQDKLGVQSDQNQQALQMATDLGNRDFQFQQANAGEYDRGIDQATQIALANASGRQQAGLANTAAQNEAGLANTNAAYQTQVADLQDRRARQQAQIDSQAAAAAAAQKQANDDRDYELKKAEIIANNDPATAAAKIKLLEAQAQYYRNGGGSGNGGAGAIPLTQQDANTQIRAKAYERTGSTVQADQILQFLGQFSGDPTNQNKTKFQFMMDAAEAAKQNPSLNSDAVASAADLYWDSYFRKSTGQ